MQSQEMGRPRTAAMESTQAQVNNAVPGGWAGLIKAVTPNAAANQQNGPGRGQQQQHVHKHDQDEGLGMEVMAVAVGGGLGKVMTAANIAGEMRSAPEDKSSHMAQDLGGRMTVNPTQAIAGTSPTTPSLGRMDNTPLGKFKM